MEVKPINCTQSPSSFPELRRFQSVVIELPILCSCLIVHIDSRTIIVSEHACTRVDSGSLKVEPINCTQSSSSFLELEHYQSVVIKRPILEKKKSGSCLIVNMRRESNRWNCSSLTSQIHPEGSNVSSNKKGFFFLLSDVLKTWRNKSWSKTLISQKAKRRTLRTDERAYTAANFTGRTVGAIFGKSQ